MRSIGFELLMICCFWNCRNLIHINRRIKAVLRCSNYMLHMLIREQHFDWFGFAHRSKGILELEPVQADNGKEGGVHLGQINTWLISVWNHSHSHHTLCPSFHLAHMFLDCLKKRVTNVKSTQRPTQNVWDLKRYYKGKVMTNSSVMFWLQKQSKWWWAQLTPAFLDNKLILDPK